MSRRFLSTTEARRILGPIGFSEVRRGATFPHWDSAVQRWFTVAYSSILGFYLEPSADPTQTRKRQESR